jgi:hypothetical protein
MTMGLRYEDLSPEAKRELERRQPKPPGLKDEDVEKEEDWLVDPKEENPNYPYGITTEEYKEFQDYMERNRPWGDRFRDLHMEFQKTLPEKRKEQEKKKGKPERGVDVWEGVEPERANIAKAIFAAARQIAEEDGDDFTPLEGPPALRSISEGFGRLVKRAYTGEMNENDPGDVVDALRLASAALVDMRQPEQYQGLKWLSGSEDPLARFRFSSPEARKSSFRPSFEIQSISEREIPAEESPLIRSWPDLFPGKSIRR